MRSFRPSASRARFVRLEGPRTSAWLGLAAAVCMLAGRLGPVQQGRLAIGVQSSDLCPYLPLPPPPSCSASCPAPPWKTLRWSSAASQVSLGRAGQGMGRAHAPQLANDIPSQLPQPPLQPSMLAAPPPPPAHQGASTLHFLRVEYSGALRLLAGPLRIYNNMPALRVFSVVRTRPLLFHLSSTVMEQQRMARET